MSANIKIFRLLFWIMVAAFVLGGGVLAIVPFVFRSNRGLTITIGLLFWIFHCVAYGLLFALTSIRKKLLQNRKSRRRFNARIGLISFFTTSVGKIFDVLTLLNIVALTVFGVYDYLWWYYLLIALMLILIQLRCVFNGKNYRAYHLIERESAK